MDLPNLHTYLSTYLPIGVEVARARQEHQKKCSEEYINRRLQQMGR